LPPPTSTLFPYTTLFRSLAKAVDDEQRAAWSVFVQGLLESSQGEYARAHTLFEESLAIHRRLQNKRGIAHALSQLALVLIERGQDRKSTRLNSSHGSISY